MSPTSRAVILAVVGAACLGLGIGVARIVFGDAGTGGAKAPLRCDPPCPEGHECLQGICVSPPASMPAMAALVGTDGGTDGGPEGIPAASVGYQRHLKCEEPLSDESKCDHTSLPSLQYAMRGRSAYLTHCYVEVREKEPELIGFVRVLARIDFTAGTISPTIHRESNITNRKIHECVLKAVKDAMKFDYPHAFDKELVSYKISFGLRPRGPDDE